MQDNIAHSWVEIEQLRRLLFLRTAWLIDKHNDYRAVCKGLAAVKVAMPKVYHHVVLRAMHLHGALESSNEMPFSANDGRRTGHGGGRRTHRNA